MADLSVTSVSLYIRNKLSYLQPINYKLNLKDIKQLCDVSKVYMYWHDPEG